MPKVANVLSNIPGVEGEKVLVAAVLQQAITDLDATDPDVRRLAYKFLQNRRAVHELTDCVGLDADVVDVLIARVLAERLTRLS